MTERWSSDDYKHWRKTGKQPKRRDAVPATHLERDTRLRSEKADALKEVDTRLCCFAIDCYRTGQTDVNGVSDKAAIDGFVQAGLLPDDSRKYQPLEPIYTEHKCERGAERTVIHIHRFDDMKTLCEWYAQEISRRHLVPLGDTE